MKSALCLLSSAVVFALAAGAAHASSDEAWADFSRQVRKACTLAVEKELKLPQLVVDPTGSPRFGMAIATGTMKHGVGVRAAFICIYDKQTKKAEIGSELGMDVVRIVPTGKAAR